MKTQKITLNVTPLWAMPKGHPQHRSGAGSHKQGVKRLRTRAASNRKAIQDHS